MANETLIKGAGFASGGSQTGGFVNLQSAYVQGMNVPMSEIGRKALQEAAYKRKQDEVELKNYVNKLEDVEIGKVEDSMRPEVTQFLVDNKNNYAEAARLAADLDADDPAYMEAVSEMNRINSAFKSLSKNLDLFKEKRTQFYDDVRNNSISKGSNLDALNSLFKNSDYAVEIDEYGNLSVENDGEYVPMTDFEEDTEYNYFLTDAEDFNKLMKLTETATSGAVKIQGGLEQNYRYQLNGLFNTMGREDLMSMMYDTVISNTPLKDREDFDQGLFDIEREGELREWLSNTYMDSLKTVAASAAKQKEIRNRPKESIAQRNARKASEAAMKRYREITSSPVAGASVQGRGGKSIVFIPNDKGGIDPRPVRNGSLDPTVIIYEDADAQDWLTK